MMKLFSFSFDSSPAILEVLSSNTFYELVDIAFQVCNPREGEDAQEHLWHITILERDDDYDSDFGDNERSYKYHPFEQEVGIRDNSANKPLGSTLKKGAKLRLTYDYGSTTKHFFTVVDVKTVQEASLQNGMYPRRKPEAPGPTVSFTTSLVNLNEEYPDLNHWLFSGGLVEMNLFRAGLKQKYGFLERHGGRMIFLPDKAESLNHYFDCLEAGAGVPYTHGIYTWQSVVVLPDGSRKIKQYSQCLEDGFCDCEIVGTGTYQTDLGSIFPKVAALGGFRKDKHVKKGWIRYKDDTLMVVQGPGGESACPKAPKGTAYDGAGFHASGIDNYLLRIQKKFASLHDILCAVEGLLGTL